jgi:hypothetical protein
MPENAEVPAMSDSSLAEAAEAAGVEVLYMCSIGECGSCEIEVVDEVTGGKRILRTCIAKVPRGKQNILVHSYPKELW